MRILDLYCKAGGAAMGYAEAGFEVVGVDIEPQPNYPFEFVQGDALAVMGAGLWIGFDAIHASPPCQAFSLASQRWINDGSRAYPDLIVPTRRRLQATGLPYVIENVVGAPLLDASMLCGTQFGLRVFRHRLFETSFPFSFTECPYRGKHPGKRIGFEPGDYVTVAGHGGDGPGGLAVWSDAMGIDWMTRAELAQAIPPAYTRLIGSRLAHYLQREAA